MSSYLLPRCPTCGKEFGGYDECPYDGSELIHPDDDDYMKFIKAVRTDGVCAACGERKNDLTEIVLTRGFIQVCDDCRPGIKEGLTHASN